uniref:Peptidase S1 domain-containing protein n=1 Tax=Anopheles dirus TaxID=7168 RepID=A0A182N980_9DIPT
MWHGRCHQLAITCVVFVALVVSRYSQSCGARTVFARRIRYGNKAEDGSWPWHAIVFHLKPSTMTYACGGSILDQNTILTAAHCLMVEEKLISLERLLVQVGKNQLWQFDSRMQEHEVHALIVHPGFSSSRAGNDIALVKLSSYISYTDYVKPISLWNRTDAENAIVGTWGTVIGFGLDESDTVSGSLREARVPVVSLIECIDHFGRHLTSSMICAGNRDGIGPCNGDSGGGLFFNFGDVWYIRGVVSFTKARDDADICDPESYTVYTDVAKHRSWIQPQLRGDSGSQSPPLEKRHPNIGLLPESICGANPYPNNEESMKPLEFGYPWMGTMAVYENATNTHRYTIVTLINDRYALTVAHLIDYAVKHGRTLLNVTLGEYTVSNPTHCGMVNGERVCAGVQNLRIEEVIIHEGYEELGTNHVNDIALIRLLDRADLSRPNVKPICLPLTATLRNEQLNEFVVTQLNSDVTRTVVSLFDRQECLRQWADSTSQLLSDHICVSAKDDFVTDCNKIRSGSPLQAVQQVFGKQRYVLHGIVYFLNYICVKSNANIFISVASHTDWILDNIRR